MLKFNTDLEYNIAFIKKHTKAIWTLFVACFIIGLLSGYSLRAEASVNPMGMYAESKVEMEMIKYAGKNGLTTLRDEYGKEFFDASYHETDIGSSKIEITVYIEGDCVYILDKAADKLYGPFEASKVNNGVITYGEDKDDIKVIIDYSNSFMMFVSDHNVISVDIKPIKEVE